MAITRAQIAKQLLSKGGRIGLRGGGADMGTVADSQGNRNEELADRADRGQRETDRLNQQISLRNEVRRQEKEKLEEKLEKFRQLNSRSRKFQNFALKFSPVAMFASQFGPLNTRDFFTDKVLGSKNFSNITREQFANLTEEEKEDMFGDYMSGRMSGATDAYGNPIGNRGGDGINQILPVDTTFAQAPSTMDQETLTPVQQAIADRGIARAFVAEGGIMNNNVVGGEMDFESARQMYGLGKLVKKVTRTVKKIAKSPIGKAALIGGGLGLAGIGPFSGLAKTKLGTALGGFFGKGSFNPLLRKVGGDFAQSTFGSMLSSIPGGGVTAAIAGASALAGLLTPAQEEEAQRISDETGIDIAEIRANPSKYLAPRFAAEGGIMRQQYQEGSKEPVAKKTMPLLDMGGMEKDYREDGGFVPIGRMEKADDVPARLSKNEFVFTADAVRNAGDGDVDKGAEVMYNMMKNLEAGGDVSEESQGLEGAREMFQTSKRLEEVL